MTTRYWTENHSRSHQGEAAEDHQEGTIAHYRPMLWVSNTLQFIINASQPAGDKIFDVSAFEKFLHDKIKVDGRVGNLGDIVQISQQGDGKIEVVAHTQFSGRYLKYL